MTTTTPSTATTTEAGQGRGDRTQDRGGWLGGGVVLLALAGLVVLAMTALGATVVGYWGWDDDVLHLSAGWAVVPAVLAAGGAACVRRATGQERPHTLAVLLASWVGAWVVMNAAMALVEAS